MRKVRIEEETVMATFYNQATLSYNGNVTSSNVTTGVIPEVLTAQKNAVNPNYTAYGSVAYVVSIINNGNTDMTNVKVVDDLGSYLPAGSTEEVAPLTYLTGSATSYVNGDQQDNINVESESPLTITGITVPAGGSTMIIYAAKPNEYAPLDSMGSITNTAVISGIGFADISASDTITPVTGAELAISKSLSPTQVAENGEVVYTFIIQNFGNSASTIEDDVIFHDDFNPILSGVTAEFNGTPWVEGKDYTYDEETGEFDSINGSITVDAAKFAWDAETNRRLVTPGVSVLVIKGRI